jgi:hypothetical protein
LKRLFNLNKDSFTQLKLQKKKRERVERREASGFPEQSSPQQHPPTTLLFLTIYHLGVAALLKSRLIKVNKMTVNLLIIANTKKTLRILFPNLVR